MIRYTCFLLCLILASWVKAQPAPQPDPKKETADEAGPETKADLTAFVKKQFPDIDPVGEHDYTKIKNYPAGKARFTYTRAMTRLLSFYIDACGQGSIIAKRFDAWANTELVNQPTFNLLHAIVCMQYPDGRPNLTAANELINKALQQDSKFEYAYYVRARLQYGAFESNQGTRAEVEKSLEAALAYPDFPEAIQLKARLLLVSKPPESVKAKALLEKCFEYTPDDPTVFQDMLGLYAEAATVAVLSDKLEVVFSSGKYSKRYEAEARAFLGYAFSREGNYDNAIKSFDKALELVKPADDATAVVRWHVNVAGTWAKMAVDLKSSKPKLEGQDRKLYDGYVQTARDHVALAAEIERTMMPIEMRGPAAAAYIEFLGAQIGELQTVITWLTGYLEKTDLRTSVRASLERLLNDLLSRVRGDEGAALKNLIAARDSGDVNRLISELGRQVENVRAGMFHFKLPESLKFFLELMSHQNDTVVQYTAFLLVDTALQGTRPDDVEAAANAIAQRLEKETELTTEARAQFQGQLLSALLIFDKRNIDLRAARAFRKIVAGTKELAKGEPELISEAREVIELLNCDVWKQRVWGNDAGNKEYSLRSSKQRKFDDLLKWLDLAIAQLETLTKDKEEKKEDGK